MLIRMQTVMAAIQSLQYLNLTTVIYLLLLPTAVCHGSADSILNITNRSFGKVLLC